MDRRIMVIQQNVPMCPDCSALMWNMIYDNHIIYVCSDCNAIFHVVKNGQSENELLVSDKMGELEDEEEKRINNDVNNVVHFCDNDS